MVARGVALLRSDVLVVPHHGSKTSSTARFLDAVAPTMAVNSLGYRNRFRHPHESVVRRYAERAIVTWRTDEFGALRIVLPVNGFPGIVRLAPPDRYWSDRGLGGQTPRDPLERGRGRFGD
jgi:competence protein ComEC